MQTKLGFDTSQAVARTAISVHVRFTGRMTKTVYNSALTSCRLFKKRYQSWKCLYSQSFPSSACKRGSPQYSDGSILNEDQPVNNCQTMSSCQSNFECTTIGSAQLCCPTVASICSIAGGRPFDSSRRTNFDPGYPMKR